LEALKTLEEQHVTVLTKTGELHKACEELFAQQQRLAAFSSSITEKLEYFNEADRAALKLNAPTLSILDSSFVDMLKRLDDCIAFVATHVWTCEW
jgi:conserved oligomeric Golgi complex subunit 3